MTETNAPRARNPRGQGERLREALIEAAIELLSPMQDVEGLSVRAVTARAGVTPTALYLHFADKDELLAAVKDRCFGELRRYCQMGQERGGTDPRARMEQACLAYLEFAAELPGHYRVLFYVRKGKRPAEPGLPAPAPASVADLPWRESGAAAFGDLVQGVEHCLPAGSDPFPTALLIFGGLHGYVGLRESIVHFPFPEPATYVGRLLDAHLGVNRGPGSGRSGLGS